MLTNMDQNLDSAIFQFHIQHFLGDRYYSESNKSKSYKVIERRVITENRGIFTNPGKKGKFTDAYFSNLVAEDKNMQERQKDQADKEKVAYMATVAERKKPDSEKAGYKAVFKPGGPQEYHDFYDKNKVKYTNTITKEIDKKLKIDKEHKTVFIENRGIFTKPPKLGTSSTPGILFNYFKEDVKQLEKIREDEDNEIRKKRAKSASSDDDKKEFKQAFRPAALKKNEPFQNDGSLYGEDAQNFKGLLSTAITNRHIGKTEI